MSDQISASHILIGHADARSGSADLSREDALAKIEGIKVEIEGGASFADQAVENSDCPSSAKGGDLGSFGPGAMVAEFDSAAFELEVDQISDVVETDFGFHLIHRTS
ncbi:MAG: peptidylprolyl isomerase [Rhodospirillales bacterium]|jgi:parvulin-like peptidyl-prolyl isomerase|nr:parvulin peptidyl-prolyl isomerase [Rhodospirillaceae bacterium]MDP6430296.1 peptidylprolyl isomerase [Rhodospirillales bacterium]MDP6646376.1 peptidylprolyl isomerase [Rhodospirillales bacterium]MDP6843037.1 peptidylprolyl isomerase [Rhodospirillales bacterium]|tara:strand:- start:656 stop:976 length:321 start_codon:yes stop_codon:yes gene_type:complete